VNDPLIILGADGQLGRAFGRLLAGEGTPFVALGRQQADLSRTDELRLPLAGARAVINCAAYTAVDAAERDEQTATLVNGTAVGHLANLCAAAGVPLVHFSTDYVFDGYGREPYSVNHRRAPLGAYGRSKACGEVLLEESSADYLLVRTSWVYAPWGQNFVRTMARLLVEKDNLRVVDDQRGRPTHVATLAERTLSLLDDDQRGTFHVADSGECTWFGFAQAIREMLGSHCELKPCTTAEFPRPAPRPAYSVLDTSRADAVLGPAPHFLERLREAIPQLSLVT
jgi:dTDP-4-dehydrorhamnose reductase